MSRNGGGLTGLIIGILLIMLLGAVMGIDSCTCGYGPEIRSTLKGVFSGK
jgi:hypothetical protein